MSEERERYQSGAATPELTPEQRADAVIMTETEEEMTPEDAARHFLSGFDWDGETTERIDTIHDDLAEVIRESEERGRVEMREKCAAVAERWYRPLVAASIRALPTSKPATASTSRPDTPFVPVTGEMHASAIRARSTALPLTPARPEPETQR